jgi:hypothetical protein
LIAYFSGLSIGISVGMFLAIKFVPEEDRKIFPSNYDIIAFACLFAGIFIMGIQSFFERKKPRQVS